jgi:hypothetical protein
MVVVGARVPRNAHVESIEIECPFHLDQADPESLRSHHHLASVGMLDDTPSLPLLGAHLCCIEEFGQLSKPIRLPFAMTADDQTI